MMQNDNRKNRNAKVEKAHPGGVHSGPSLPTDASGLVALVVFDARVQVTPPKMWFKKTSSCIMSDHVKVERKRFEWEWKDTHLPSC
jgi:hypothetical protein